MYYLLLSILTSAAIMIVFKLFDLVLSEASDDQGRLEILGFRLVRTSSDIGVLRFAIVGLMLMLLMIFRPQGLFGNRKEMALDGR